MIQYSVLSCGSGKQGTYFPGCKVSPTDFVKFFLLSPLADINLATDTFDESDRSLLIKRGLLVPVNDILQVTPEDAKANIQTLANKRKLLVSKALYQWTAEFEATPCYQEALDNLSYQKWGLLMLDSQGKLWFDNKNGKLKGFDVNAFVVENESTNDGGSKRALFSAWWQLSQDGTAGYNKRREFLVSDEYIDVNGIQDVVIKDITLAHSSFKVSVLSGCDKSTPIVGLDDANFKVVKASDGTTVSTTVTDNGDGTYNIAGAAAGDVTVRLYDSVLNSNIADILETQFFESNILAITLT
ncbi:hypothetical protein OX284_014245 [Flavobacterium sp. SUN046]|uniref:hypothetical protein n=1 Tax=Flavobacterium sp. SUN046 TaxID=3002440 RepID=UPI002DB8418A|nr:hypothetical protein [Flavobacterium sp. SUN046]MEC4050596.1 hypothetical protein [Flavobacterium sp. SUN046]